MDDLVTSLIVTCNYETYIAASESVTHRKGLQSTVILPLKFKGVKVITCTLNIAKIPLQQVLYRLH